MRQGKHIFAGCVAVLLVLSSDSCYALYALPANPEPAVSAPVVERTVNASLADVTRVEVADRKGDDMEKSNHVTIDTTPPVTTLLDGTQIIEAGDTVYSRGRRTFRLRAVDEGSGVAKTEYRIGSGKWRTYRTGVVINGNNTLRFRSRDVAGNVEAEKRIVVRVDKTPPRTAIHRGEEQVPFASGGYVSGAAVFTLQATDSESGVTGTEYAINRGKWNASAPFSLVKVGKYTIRYRSVDRLGNREPVRSVAVLVDTVPPQTTISLGLPRHTEGNTLYASSKSTFTLKAADDRSGVRVTQYRIDGDEWKAYAPFTIAAEERHHVEYRSVDVAGNFESVRSLAVVIDNTPPETTLVIAARPPEDTDRHVAGLPPCTLSTSDKISGVAKVDYRIDGGAWREYAGAFGLGKEGSHVVEYRSADKVGNVVTTRTLAEFPVSVARQSPDGKATSAGDAGTAGRRLDSAPDTAPAQSVVKAAAANAGDVPAVTGQSLPTGSANPVASVGDPVQKAPVDGLGVSSAKPAGEGVANKVSGETVAVGKTPEAGPPATGKTAGGSPEKPGRTLTVAVTGPPAPAIIPVLAVEVPNFPRAVESKSPPWAIIGVILFQVGFVLVLFL